MTLIDLLFLFVLMEVLNILLGLLQVDPSRSEFSKNLGYTLSLAIVSIIVILVVTT